MKTIEERITKKTNLKVNDSLSSFDGHSAQQFHDVYQVFYDFIKEVKPKRILEIGTALGGFTIFLKTVTDELNLNTNILTFDITARPWYDDMRKKGIDVRVEDIFGDFSEIPTNIKEFIQSEGVTIVLCDGGWKIGEFNLLSKFIKNDDFILAHDYCLDKITFEKEINNQTWNWCEIIEDDISESSKVNNLEFYNQDTFSKVVWVCKTKKS
jgi:cephalosporin hydroxylase